MGLTVKIGLQGADYSKYNLDSVEFGVKCALAEGIYKAGKNIEQNAKRLLAERIKDKKASTGDLERAIKHSFNPNPPQPYSLVHVDERIADYGEWVEFGHFANGTWFSGHHFMGDAFKMERSKIGGDLKMDMVKELDKYDVFKHPRVGTRVRTRPRGLPGRRRTGAIVAGFRFK